MGILSKTELLHELYKVGEGKANSRFDRLAILSVFAGVFISLSAFSYIVINTGMSALNPTYAKFISGICFSFGLFAVVVSGGELFTGNILLVAPFLAKKITFPKMIRNWVVVYLFNFIGAIFISLCVYYSSLTTPQMYQFLHKICIVKTASPWLELLFKGIGCNILVCLGVWMTYASKDAVGKFFACLMSIIVFLVCGFEHSIANMFYLVFAYITNDISLGAMFYDLVPVTVGNIIGGALVAIGYYFAYREQ